MDDRLAELFKQHESAVDAADAQRVAARNEKAAVTQNDASRLQESVLPSLQRAAENIRQLGYPASAEFKGNHTPTAVLSFTPSKGKGEVVSYNSRSIEFVAVPPGRVSIYYNSPNRSAEHKAAQPDTTPRVMHIPIENINEDWVYSRVTEFISYMLESTPK